ESLFGAKGPAKFLTKATMFLGLLFVLNTLFLGYTYNQERNKSAIDKIKPELLIPASQTTENQAPIAPETNIPNKAE
ncbi:preprotein translocase subunit SecG, partial [Aliarcobacter butzleri]